MSENKKDFLSVVMPVHNGERYLRHAIESVLSQTYANFEFIIVNDGSRDASAMIIKEYQEIDARIRVININPNAGVSNARNVGIDAAVGDYIVNVDCDDINDSQRFLRQLDYFRSSNKEIDVLGTWFRLFYDDAKDGYKSVPVDILDIYDGKPPVHNPTCMIKKSTFLTYGKYNTKYDNAEDYELWSRWSFCGVVFDNLPENLYEKRIHDKCTSIARIKHQIYLMLKINIIAVFLYKRKFTRSGYLRMLEQLAYLIYLGLRLDKIFRRSSVLERIKKNDN
jgi:glycosyltransferase involved in cell wall biosynthesis